MIVRWYTVPISFGLQYSEVEIPRGGQILGAYEWEGQMRVWALVDPTIPEEARKIYIIATGDDVPREAQKYIGTVIINDVFTWHLFEEI